MKSKRKEELNETAFLDAIYTTTEFANDTLTIYLRLDRDPVVPVRELNIPRHGNRYGTEWTFEQAMDDALGRFQRGNPNLTIRMNQGDNEL